MRKLDFVTLVVAVLAMVTGCTMWGRQKKDWAGATSGEQFERLWWEGVKHQRFDHLERRTAATFLGVTPEGTLSRAGLIQHLRDNPVTDYTLGDFVTQSNGSDLTVAYVASFKASLPGRPSRIRFLSVWQETKDGWILTAQSATPEMEP